MGKNCGFFNKSIFLGQSQLGWTCLYTLAGSIFCLNFWCDCGEHFVVVLYIEKRWQINIEHWVAAEKRPLLNSTNGSIISFIFFRPRRLMTL